MSTSQIATPSGLSLCAEEFPGDGPPILLIMGLGAQMLLWPDGFCEQLAARGHRVIRFDNRDVGLSTRLRHLGVPSVPRQYVRARLRLPITPPYTLSEMAQDAVAVLDHYELDRATVVGASMGGMIAQHLASSHASRVAALVSVMSSPSPGRPHFRAIRALVKRPEPGRQGYIDQIVRLQGAIGSQSLPPPDEQIAALAARCFDRGPSPDGFARQFTAILADGDRSAMLRELKLPVLVIHGDDDPLIPLRYGIRSAKLMNARLQVVQGMGHSLPPARWDEITEGISLHASAHATA